MALATQCPHCGTMFRVAADQLKLRGGIVRCGSCQQIFDGNAALVDLAAAAPAALPASPPSSPPLSAASGPTPQAPVASAQDTDEEPIYTLELDRTFSPFGIIPHLAGGDEEQPADGVRKDDEALVTDLPEEAARPVAEAQPEAEPAYLPGLAAAAEAGPAAVDAPPSPMLDMPVDEALVAAPAPDDGHGMPEPTPAPAARPKATRGTAAPLLLRESGPATVTMPAPLSAPPVAPRLPRTKAAEARAARRSKLTPTRIEPPRLRVPESDEPEFVRRGRQRERSGKAVRIAMSVGSVLLLLILAAQAAYSFRDTLAARYPGMKPALVSLCGALGCRVELPAHIDQLVIETGELTTLGGNAYTFTTLLRNQGDSVQAWPSLELTLSDPDDKPLVRRVFGPRDYLPAGPLPASGFAAHAEQAIKLHFRVEEPAPSGYHIAVFYP